MFFNIKLYNVINNRRWEEEIYVECSTYPTEEEVLQVIEKQLGPDEVLEDFSAVEKSIYID